MVLSINVNPAGTELILSGVWFGKEDHCDCGTGCAECWGTIRCGCPDCYQPQTRTLKIRKAKSKKLKLDTPEKLPDNDTNLLFETATITHAVSEAKEKVKIVVVNVEVGDVVLRRSHKSVDYKRHTVSFVETSRLNRNRLSMPELPKFEPKRTERKSKERIREPFIEKKVGPPKQTRYFCKTCNVNVCNVCVSSTCGAHNVQFLGSGYFHCQSPHHKIQHEHNPL